MSSSRPWSPMSVLAVVFLVASSWPAPAQESQPEVDPATIWTGTVERGDLTLQVRGPGTLQPFGDGLHAHVRIAAPHAGRLDMGQQVSLDTRRAGEIEGRVVHVSHEVENGTVEVIVELTDEVPEGLPAGLSIDARIDVGQLEDVIYVQRPAFGMPDETSEIFKLEEDGAVAERVEVLWGPASIDKIVVAEGLEVGDTIILSDMSRYTADLVRISQ